MLVLDPVLMLVLSAVLLAASGCDLYRRRIPNVLIVIAILARFLVPLIRDDSMDILSVAAGGVVGLLVFMIPYAFGKMGAGDVKLMLVCGLYLGPRLALETALYAMLAGGLLALIGLAYRSRVPANRADQVTIPYGVAIALGAWSALLMAQ